MFKRKVEQFRMGLVGVALMRSAPFVFKRKENYNSRLRFPIRRSWKENLSQFKLNIHEKYFLKVAN